MDILAPRNDNIIQAITRTDWTARASYAKLFGKMYYILSNQTNLLNLEWDYLIILDGARRDLFEIAMDDVAPEIATDVETITSVASTTREWGYRTFQYHDGMEYGYITANPNVPWEEYDPEIAFDPLVDVYTKEFSPVLGVPPQVMSENVLQSISNSPDKQWICHYIQPHAPFIAPEVNHPDLPRSAYDKSPNVWDYLAAGEINPEAVREAYLANHRFVLREVLWLLGELPPNKTVLITSDHGNGMGGIAGYYGHGEGVYLPSLIRVPALWVETGESQAARPAEVNPPIDAKTGRLQDDINETVDKQLKILGYID